MSDKKPTSFFVVDCSDEDLEVNKEFICTKIEETRFDKRVYLRGKSKWIEQNTIKSDAVYTTDESIHQCKNCSSTRVDKKNKCDECGYKHE